MTKAKFLVNVALYLYGDMLNPNRISASLGVEPTTSWRKGDKRRSSTGKEAIAKTGLWTFGIKTEGDTLDLPRAVDELVDKVGAASVNLKNLPGVDRGHVDIHILLDTNERGGGTAEFELSEQNVSTLKPFGLPVQFTVSVIEP